MQKGMRLAYGVGYIDKCIDKKALLGIEVFFVLVGKYKIPARGEFDVAETKCKCSYASVFA